jgi:cytochrome c-type biogenesis protein CcmH/NrfG
MPERPEPLNNLGMVYEAAERLDRAIAYYEEAVEFAPTNPVYIGNLAKAHLRHGMELSDVQGMLQEMIFYDSRPEWVACARDLL